jgi:hypothetical protein
MARMLRLSIGLLAVSFLTVFGLRATTGQEATPPPYYELPEGLSIDALADTPNITFPADTTISVGVSRFIYQPGVRFELEYHGPVLYVVEQDKLALNDVNRLVLSATYDEIDASPPPLGVKEGEEFILVQGQSVFSEDGHFGPTRNAGERALVVLAVLIVPNPGGMTWDITGDPNATPMSETEMSVS